MLIRKKLGMRPKFYKVGPGEWMCAYPNSQIVYSLQNETEYFFKIKNMVSEVRSSRQMVKFLREVYNLKDV